MPHSISYQFIINDLITRDRISSYANVFRTQSDIELVGAYLWNINICSSLYPLLSSAEVTLRNAIDTAIIKDLGYFWWTTNKLHFKSFNPRNQNDLPFAVKAIRTNFSTATDLVKRDKKTRYRNTSYPTHQEIIAKTEFSTWEFILDNEFMRPDLIWPKRLGDVFKGHWGTTKTSKLLSNTKDLVKTVREFRNRVSHHEPVWKRYGVANENDAITHLHEKINKIIALIEIVSPEKRKLLEKNQIIERTYRACSIEELRYFQHTVKTHNVKSISKIFHIATQAKNNNKIEKIKMYKNGKIEFSIYPS